MRVQRVVPGSVIQDDQVTISFELPAIEHRPRVNRADGSPLVGLDVHAAPERLGAEAGVDLAAEPRHDPALGRPGQLAPQRPPARPPAGAAPAGSGGRTATRRVARRRVSSLHQRLEPAARLVQLAAIRSCVARSSRTRPRSVRRRTASSFIAARSASRVLAEGDQLAAAPRHRLLARGQPLGGLAGAGQPAQLGPRDAGQVVERAAPGGLGRLAQPPGRPGPLWSAASTRSRAPSAPCCSTMSSATRPRWSSSRSISRLLADDPPVQAGELRALAGEGAVHLLQLGQERDLAAARGRGLAPAHPRAGAAPRRALPSSP